MNFKLSVRAENDIIAIAEEGIRLFGPIQAKRYHDDLFNVLDLIGANPQIARERKEISPPVRIHPFKTHLIVYQISGNGTIFVIRIRHRYEDWSNGPD